jgi:aldose sugar dehydrogenase
MFGFGNAYATEPPMILPLSILLPACSDPKPASDSGSDTAAYELLPHTCTYSEAHGEPGTVDIGVQTIASGLATPWGIGWLPDGDMLITERDGRISRVSGGVVQGVAEVPSVENAEGGLLGIAIDPGFAASRFFYIYYTASSGGGIVNRVARWRLSDDGASATEDAVIVDGIPAMLYHNGGRLRIGPDGKLYIGTGDAGVPGYSQDLQSLGGKILRVELDGSVPADNPFPGEPAFLTGVRNSQGFGWRADGRMIVTDHGPSGLSAENGRSDHDEVTLAEEGDNLGWPDVYACEEGEGFRAASITWSRAMPPGGAAVYTGTELPDWQGDLIIGVLGFESDTPHLHRLRLDRDGNVLLSESYLHGAEGYGRLRDVAMGPDGGLYVTTSNCDGRGNCGAGDRILRIGAPD